MSTDLPKYKCHKEVHAVKIGGIDINLEDQSAVISPIENRNVPFRTEPGWVNRFKGTKEDLGYFVRYSDGYTSWSPSEEFEKGYSRI